MPMLMLLSPAKTLDYETPLPKVLPPATQPDYLAQSEQLIAILRKKSVADIQDLMGISEKLGVLNAQRFKDFSQPFTPENARACILAFRGDVYDGLHADDFSKADFTFAQSHLRILSGLYGLLRPLDLIQPYRLEMGTKLANKRGKDLYAFWGTQLAEAINEAAKAAKTDIVVNLASEEYSKAVDRKALKVQLISPQFKEEKGNQLRILSLFAKRARGMMARHLIQSQAKDFKALQSFKTDGYRFRVDLSTEETPVFARPQPAAKAA
jgi:cytoplasmic iron level regulating protein YaaA (DUF328/UPF0246 family)